MSNQCCIYFFSLKSKIDLPCDFYVVGFLRFCELLLLLLLLLLWLLLYPLLLFLPFVLRFFLFLERDGGSSFSPFSPFSSFSSSNIFSSFSFSWILASDYFFDCVFRFARNFLTKFSN